MNYDLLQSHTVEIYHLRDHVGRISRIPARSLLKPQRFDLFAKLYYIDNIESNKEQALRVYVEHIKAFNPDGREPGRDDKNGVSDFVDAFNQLISRFKQEDFDETQSIVPVDKNGVILDGAHRVAALAYYNRHVVVAQFDDVVSKCDFDYLYFRDRAMPWSVCDIIALEMTKWLDSLLVACLWPRIGGDSAKKDAVIQLSKNHEIAYLRTQKVNLESLSRFVGEIYRNQSWTKNLEAVKNKAMRIYGNNNRMVWFVFFMNHTTMDDIIAEKDNIRRQYEFDKDSLHITDNIEETRQIAEMVMTPQGVLGWNNITRSAHFSFCAEKWNYFKKVTWIQLKVKVWNIVFSKH